MEFNVLDGQKQASLTLHRYALNDPGKLLAMRPSIILAQELLRRPAKRGSIVHSLLQCGSNPSTSSGATTMPLP